MPKSHFHAFTLTLFICVVTLSSCFDADRGNPLDAGSFGLFIPQIGRPIGGEEMFPGIPQEIRWRPAARILDSTVDIQLICDGDTTLVAGGIRNTGTYAWLVPDSPSADCRIRIVGQGGASVSPRTFRIRKLPVEAVVDFGGWDSGLDDGPHEPSVLREEIVFTATQGGNTDVWRLDRSSGNTSPSRITSGVGYDGQPVWLKPNGTVIAYTSEDSSGQREVWIRATEGNFGPQTTRISQLGGENPAWRNMVSSDAFGHPALVYRRPVNAELSGLVTADIDFTMAALPRFDLPLAFVRNPVLLPLHTGLPEGPLQRTAWYADGNTNYLMYGGRAPSRIYNVDFPAENYQLATNSPVGLPPGLLPAEPSISPDGQYITFTSHDDIWMAPISGVVAWRLTFGPAEDRHSDWATETEIVFQRRSRPGENWALWTVLRPDDVP